MDGLPSVVMDRPERSGTGDPAPDVAPVEVVLRDGTAIDLVAMLPADATRLVRFHQSLSAETIYRRFLSFHPELAPAELLRFTQVDHREREAIVAVSDDELIAVARFDRIGHTSAAEVAFVVADSWQGRGLGTVLFDHLAARARALGITRFEADTLAGNGAMLAVFHHAGLPVREQIDSGVVSVSIDLTSA